MVHYGIKAGKMQPFPVGICGSFIIREAPVNPASTGGRGFSLKKGEKRAGFGWIFPFVRSGGKDPLSNRRRLIRRFLSAIHAQKCRSPCRARLGGLFDFSLVATCPAQKRKKRKAHAFLSIFPASVSLGSQNLTAIVRAASLASSMGHNRFAALGANRHAGSGQLPVRATALITAGFGYFTLGDSHG